MKFPTDCQTSFMSMRIGKCVSGTLCLLLTVGFSPSPLPEKQEELLLFTYIHFIIKLCTVAHAVYTNVRIHTYTYVPQFVTIISYMHNVCTISTSVCKEENYAECKTYENFVYVCIYACMYVVYLYGCLILTIFFVRGGKVAASASQRVVVCIHSTIFTVGPPHGQ